MENAKNIFEEIINSFNGALSKERNRISFTLETKGGDLKPKTHGVLEKKLTIFRGDNKVVFFNEKTNVHFVYSITKYNNTIEDIVFANAIKALFLEGIDSFQRNAEEHDIRN